MTSAPENDKLALRAQIKDNFRYISEIEGDPMIAVATHDKLYWVIVNSKVAPRYWFPVGGHETEEAALPSMANDLSVEVWKKAKNNNRLQDLRKNI